mgnify:CR=1 FL=1
MKSTGIRNQTSNRPCSPKNGSPKNSSPNAQIGNEGELHADTYLEQQGLTHIESNFLAKVGDIDLLMKDGNTLVFVEVRLRKKLGYGSAIDTVTYAKQKKLRKTAQLYMLKRFQTLVFDSRFYLIRISSCPTNQSQSTTCINYSF